MIFDEESLNDVLDMAREEEILGLDGFLFDLVKSIATVRPPFHA
jgi:hypothetical protein